MESMMVARGKFITFEGIDGAGKSTHLDWFSQQLQEKLRAQEISVRTTREPGGTPSGEQLRDLILHQPMQLETETLLIFAARSEHLASVIMPTLARGDWVVCDRFTDASFAYQGGGRGLALDRLAILENWVQGDFQPDLTVLFDLPVETANRRRAMRAPLDRFERESEQFFTQVRAEYLRRARAAPHRFVLIDARSSITEIRQTLERIILALIQDKTFSASKNGQRSERLFKIF
jgi:dTMP kinase